MTAPTARCRLDHLVVTATELAGGAAHIEQLLGVALAPGGAHPKMSTHNRLLRLGDAVYLEVIAPDPAAPPPGRPRWFGLDDLAPGAAPQLATWVARTDDIAATAAAASAAHQPLGEIEALSRAAMRWQMTVPADGALVLGGTAPLVIQWQDDPRVASRLPDAGCTLRALELCHPEPRRLAALLASIGFSDAAVAITPSAAGAPPCLIAHIATPAGLRRLGP